MTAGSPFARAAFAVPRPAPDEEDAEDLAEVIDLVQLPLGARPTPLAYVDWEEVPRLRIFACESYHRCLGFASRVRWKSFHCRQCPRNPEKGNKLPEHETGPAVLVDLRD